MTEPHPTPFTPEEETRAIEMARQDPQAFTSLYRAYVDCIYRYLYSRVENKGDAEDLTSQVFMEALEGINRYRHQGLFRAWLFSIARHRLINFHKRRAPYAEGEGEEIEGSPVGDPYVQTLRDEERREVMNLIGALSEEEQEILRLRFVAELSFAEIGIVCGRKKDAVKKQLYRLLARLESQLEVSHD